MNIDKYKENLDKYYNDYFTKLFDDALEKQWNVEKDIPFRVSIKLNPQEQINLCNFGYFEFLNKYCLQKSTMKNKLNWYKTKSIGGEECINFSISNKKYSIFNILKNSQKD